MKVKWYETVELKDIYPGNETYGESSMLASTAKGIVRNAVSAYDASMPNHDGMMKLSKCMPNPCQQEEITNA